MKKLLIIISLLITSVYLSSAIDIVLNSGEKLDSSNWDNLSGVLNKVDISGSESNPLKNCKTILASKPTSTDGLYYIDPNGGDTSDKFQAYCDMITDGGGWTLMYRYTFNNYASFNSTNNALTPRPNRSYISNSTVSTTPPTNTTNGAINFSLWGSIIQDDNILTKSNITNWYRCTNGAGLFANKQAGNVSCVIENNIMNVGNHTPTSIAQYNGGPAFNGSSYTIYYDGHT